MKVIKINQPKPAAKLVRCNVHEATHDQRGVPILSIIKRVHEVDRTGATKPVSYYTIVRDDLPPYRVTEDGACIAIMDHSGKMAVNYFNLHLHKYEETPVTEPLIHLELSMQEAAALKGVLGAYGGGNPASCSGVLGIEDGKNSLFWVLGELGVQSAYRVAYNPQKHTGNPMPHLVEGY